MDNILTEFIVMIFLFFHIMKLHVQDVSVFLYNAYSSILPSSYFNASLMLAHSLALVITFSPIYYLR